MRMKELKEDADHCAKIHMAADEPWTHGKVTDAWKDEEGNLCVQYEDGCWWHYEKTENGLKWR